MGNPKSIAIVGAGVAGITTAYFLGKKGYKVRLHDPNGVAEECSYANGGQLSVCNAEVWNTYSNIIEGNPANSHENIIKTAGSNLDLKVDLQADTNQLKLNGKLSVQGEAYIHNNLNVNVILMYKVLK